MTTPFSNYLKQCRIDAGFKSLSEVAKISEKSHKNMPPLSKAKLSLYERGAIDTIKPEVLRLLSKIYRISYDDLAWRWFRDRYGADNDKRGTAHLMLSDSRACQLESDDRSITLFSLKHFEHEQSKAPAGALILVSAPQFLDDTIFFKMVLANLKKGVRYFYLLPESQRINYRHLVSRIASEASELSDRVDGSRTFFIPRSDFDTPINQVLFLLPSGEVRGYVGLLDGEKPFCYQLAEERFALRLFHAFLWMIRIAFNAEISQGVKKLEGYYATELRENCESPIELIAQILEVAQN